MKSRYTSARAVAVLSGLFLVLASGNVLAQGTASITGTVVDTSQAAVPGSEVILTNTGTAQSTTKTTSDQGFFVFPDLSPGIYKVTATKAGFKAWTQDGITLQVAQQITLYPQLQVGLATEQVEVTSTAAFLTTSSSTISGVIESQEIQQLPLNGRNALQLQELQPGVISTGTGGQFGAQQVSFSSSGGRDIDINYSLDGGINVNPFYALANYYPNPDALQEFSLSSRNYSAQFGRGSTDVSAVTRSGTNSFHGSAFEFLRNTALDSTPFFGTTVPAFHRNQFGGAIGGPILKNRLFFFASYQGTQQSGSPGNQVYTTIPLAERGLNGTDAVFPASTPVIDPLTGEQFPNNTIPNSRITSQPEKFFQEFLPAPNLGANSYQFSSAATQREHQAVGKVDYTLTKQDSVFVRYFLDDYPSTGYGNGTGSALGTSWLSNFPYRYQDTTVGWVHTFSPSLLNVARVTYQRSVFGEQTSLPFSLSAIGYDVNTESAYSTNGLTPDSDLSITGAFGAYPGAPTRDIMPTWDVNDNLTWIKGRHTINTGFVIYHNRINELQNFFTGGSMTFNGQFSGTGASDFLLGDFSNYTQISGLSSRLHQTLPSAYVQDDVKLTPRLTVNAGLRVDIVSGYHSEDGQLMTLQPGQQSTVFPLATQGLLFAGDKGIPADIIGTRTDIAPRLGIAWDVFGNGKTSLRAGAGIFYIPMTEGISLNRQTLIQPFCLEVSLNAGDAENIWAQPPFNGKDPYPIASSPSGLKSVPFVVGGSETTMPTKWKTQVSNEWSLSLQQAVFKTGVFEADYVGSSSSHMFTSAQANWGQYINIDGGPPTESNLQQRRIYPDIGPIELDADLLSANYNALQISYNQRLANTLTLKSSYTWSKNLGVNSGEGAGGNGPRDPYNYHLDYSNVGTSEPQVWVTGFIWQAFGDHSFGSKLMQYAAGGWQLGGIISINSGTPLDIVSGLDNSLTGIGEDTPDLIGDWHAHNSGRSGSIAHWFNQGAFAQNATGTFGTFRPNTIFGPGYVNFDINMQKNFAITEKIRSEFRSSFYNAFNHANLGNPGTTLTSSNFGVINSINSSSSPRVIEFGLRILF